MYCGIRCRRTGIHAVIEVGVLPLRVASFQSHVLAHVLKTGMYGIDAFRFVLKVEREIVFI